MIDISNIITRKRRPNELTVLGALEELSLKVHETVNVCNRLIEIGRIYDAVEATKMIGESMHHMYSESLADIHAYDKYDRDAVPCELKPYLDSGREQVATLLRGVLSRTASGIAYLLDCGALEFDATDTVPVLRQHMESKTPLQDHFNTLVGDNGIVEDLSTFIESIGSDDVIGGIATITNPMDSYTTFNMDVDVAVGLDHSVDFNEMSKKYMTMFEEARDLVDGIENVEIGIINTNSIESIRAIAQFCRQFTWRISTFVNTVVYVAHNSKKYL